MKNLRHSGGRTGSQMAPRIPLEESVREYLRRQGQSDPDQHTNLLLSRGGYEDRFHYLSRFVKPEHRRSLLVSGAGAGTELLVAKDFGFDFVLGTEVGADWARFSAIAVGGSPRCGVVLYDGARLPLPDESMTAVASGHIIEHTADARQYLYEHLRVLCRGGLFFLEFPDRYHPVELHTSLPSFEWAPARLRHFCYSLLAEAHAANHPRWTRMYDFIRTLVPVGVPDVFQWLAAWPAGDGHVRHCYRPLPGYVRMILTRRPDGAPPPTPAPAELHCRPDETGKDAASAGLERGAGSPENCLRLIERLLQTVLELFATFQLGPARDPRTEGQAPADNTTPADPLPSEADLALRHLGLWADRALASLGGPDWPSALAREPWASQASRLLLDYEAAVCGRFGGRPLPVSRDAPPPPEPRSGRLARPFWGSLQQRLRAAWPGLAAGASRGETS